RATAPPGERDSPTSRRRFSARGASEGLPQPDVDLELVVTGAASDRSGEVYSDRADRCVVPEACSATEAQGARQRVEIVADLPGVDEHRKAQTRADALAEFSAASADGGAASRIAVRERGTDRLVAVAADGAASAGIEALVGWEAELAGAPGEA